MGHPVKPPGLKPDEFWAADAALKGRSSTDYGDLHTNDAD